MSALPKISIISPSFNCVGLIKRCIESVRAQGYPNFEHIIVDGASTDGTVEVLKLYPHLRWISEPDKGEAEALNKALRMVSGDIVNWLNVDDSYAADTVFSKVVDAAAANPDRDIFYGKGISVNEQGEVLWYRRPIIELTLPLLLRWFANPNLFQPTMFYRRRVTDSVGFFREDLHYGIDYEYWLRVAAKGYRSHFIEQVLATATLVRDGAKSGAPYEDQHLAWVDIAKPYIDALPPAEQINYWRDFYFYRIRPPVEYKHELTLPDTEFGLHGFLIAAFELGHIPLAAVAIERLTATAPQTPETYFLLSEVLHATQSTELAAQAAAHGLGLNRRR